MPTTASDPIGNDYESIHAAVQATPRGRWFLAEYARRNRQADTQMLLVAIARLESAVRSDTMQGAGARLKGGLADMAARIARTKRDIAATPLDPGQDRSGSADDLGAVVRANNGATSDILAAAEHVQETAWTLREQGFKPETCDFLDAQATDIYTACSFQDLAGQQVRKVVDTLGYVETRLSAMISLWDVESAPLPSAALEGGHPEWDAEPAAMIAEAPSIDAPSVSPATEMAASSDHDGVAPAKDASSASANDGLTAALATLSEEEKIALFT